MRFEATKSMKSHLLLIAASLVVVSVAAERLQDVDATAALWKKLLLENRDPSSAQLSELDFKYILEHAPPGTFDHLQGDDEVVKVPAVAGPPPLVFPELTPKQRKFAVHPGFKSYHDSRFRKAEGISEEDAAVNAEEIATDPFASGNKEDKHQSPKKAAQGPIFGGGGGSSSSTREATVDQARIDDIYFTTIVAVSSALAVFAIIGAGFCYHRVRRNSKASEDVEYPAYGVTGPGKETSPTAGTDRKLAQNAQMYHYQHQKQQMLAFDSANGSERQRGHNGASVSDCESDDGEEGDYTVYECPGLAPAGEMEVRNPLFQDDPTPKSK